MPLSPLDLTHVQTRPGSGATVAELREMADCELHGQYLVRQSSGPDVFVHNPGGCPDCLRAKRADKLLAASNIPARFSACEFANYVAKTPEQKRVLSACKAYANDFESHLAEGRGLIMVGNPGTGKNHLATAMAKVISARRHTVLRVKAAEFLDAYWAKDFAERDAWMREMAGVHLLILDEVGRSSATANAQNAFFRLIDARYEAMRPTMVLSNLDRQGLIDVLGDAAYDRLTEAGAKRLTFDWQSARASAAKEAAHG